MVMYRVVMNQDDPRGNQSKPGGPRGFQVSLGSGNRQDGNGRTHQNLSKTTVQSRQPEISGGFQRCPHAKKADISAGFQRFAEAFRDVQTEETGDYQRLPEITGDYWRLQSGKKSMRFPEISSEDKPLQRRKRLQWNWVSKAQTVRTSAVITGRNQYFKGNDGIAFATTLLYKHP